VSRARFALGLGLLGLGCRPPADGGTPIDGEHAGDEHVEPPSTSADEGSLVEVEPGEEEGNEPEPEASPCELSCADVHACVLVEGRTVAEASTIELGCLDGCVRAPTAFTSCPRPQPVDQSGCSEFLGCTRRAWPDEERPPTIVDEPTNGCAAVCAAFSICKWGELLAVEECTKMCKLDLDPEQEQVAMQCTKLPECEAILRCIDSVPHATKPRRTMP
jgi:hypothetical protein